MKTKLKNLMICCLIASIAVIFPACVKSAAKTPPWKSLFDGETLDGWVERSRGGQKTKIRVEDQQIVGTITMNAHGSFLCTEKDYEDFILELEFKIEENLNSGIQIRSNTMPGSSRVHGYQVEIDPTDRAWTAGIYDQSRRGWLHPVDDENTQAKEAFKHGEWNQLRIEVIGDIFKTWLNGVPAAHFQDDRTKKGFIALQFHPIKKKENSGKTTRFRNIKIITKNLGKYSKPSPLPLKNMYNKLTANEKRRGWKLLFDGKTSKGWRGSKIDKFPEFGWQIKDGMLTVLESGGGEAAHGGDIVTTRKYRNFELWVDFKITPGANSGIKYYVDTKLNKGPGSSIGLEYQILDDKRHPDAKRGNHKGSRTLASLYDLIEAENKHPNPIGEWNHARIISNKGHVEHWLNGRKVLEYERGSKQYRKIVAESKYKKWPSFGELPEGEILLQDHGNRVSFRNVMIKELN